MFAGMQKMMILPLMKRKIIRGGSWKDVGYYLQTGTSTYEYQDSTKSYIGFRSVIDLPAAPQKGRRRYKSYIKEVFLRPLFFLNTIFSYPSRFN